MAGMTPKAKGLARERRRTTGTLKQRTAIARKLKGLRSKKVAIPNPRKRSSWLTGKGAARIYRRST